MSYNTQRYYVPKRLTSYLSSFGFILCVFVIRLDKPKAIRGAVCDTSCVTLDVFTVQNKLFK